MSINLLDLLNNDVGSKLLGPASKFLGESEHTTNNALSGLLSSILAALMDKGGNQSGAADIMAMLSKTDPELLDSLSDRFSGASNSGSLSSLASQGSQVLGSLCDNNKLSTLVTAVTDHSGMKKSSCATLVKLITPFVMSAIAAKVKAMDLDVSGLGTLLGSQGAYINAALPAGFEDYLEIARLSDQSANSVDSGTDKLKNVSSTTIATTEYTTGTVGDRASHMTDPVMDNRKKGALVIMKWVLAVFIALLVLGILFRQGYMAGVKAKDATAAAGVTHADNMTNGAGEVDSEAAGDVMDMDRDALRGVFATVDDDAKAALGDIEFAVGSIGDQIMNFIKNDFSGDDIFTFLNLTFDTQAATIRSGSLDELDHLAGILRAYTGVRVMVQVHTGHIGSHEASARLSMARANSVKARLVEQGIDTDRIVVAEYAGANPEVPQDAPEDRTQNQRIELKIVK